MSMTLRANYVQDKISIFKEGQISSLTFNPGKDTLLMFENGKSAFAGCMNCINPKCINIMDKDVECKEFPDISHNMNRHVCPVNAIKSGANSIIIDENNCIGCGLCASNCPVGAIYLKDGKAKVSVRDEKKHILLHADNAGVKKQQKYIDEIKIEKIEGSIQKETDEVMKIIYSKIKKMTQEEQNIMVRNLLIGLGNHATLARQGNVYMRMDGFYSNNIQFGVIEIETGAEMLDVSRAILDDVAMIDVRYNILRKDDQPIAVVLSLPNKRTDYWQVLKDIKEIINLPIRTITFGALLILLWNNKKVYKFDDFYIDVDNSSIRKEVVKLLGRKADVSYRLLGILENSK